MDKIVEGYIKVFKTRKLFELYAAASLLEEKDMSFYMQETSADGVRIALPFQKRSSGMGFFNINSFGIDDLFCN
jgi:hypothetical protein